MENLKEEPKLHNHFIHYSILVGGLAVIGFLIMLFRYDPFKQAGAVLAGSIFYSSWGIIHHAIEGRLTKLIALEYVLLSLLAFVVIFAALFI